MREPNQSSTRISGPDAVEAPDAALVALIRMGDAGAFTELTRRHSTRLRWVAQRVLKNVADAEDAVQAALWKAYQHFADYREHAAVSTWLSRITLNEALGLLRKRRARPFDQYDSAARIPEERYHRRLPATTLDPEREFLAKEVQMAVRRCLGQLPSRYRTVVRLAAFGELSQEQIAGRLGLSVGAVKTRLHRARAAMREILDEQRVAA